MLIQLLTAALLAAPAADGPQPADVSGLTLEPGLSLRVYDLGEPLTRLPDLIEGQTGNVNRRIEQVDLGNGDFGLEDQFYAEVAGFLVIERPGEYEFELYSDDGSELLIGGALVVGHDGLHSDEIPGDGVIELAAGTYPITVRMFEAGGAESARLYWRPPGAGDHELVPASAFRDEADQVRVVSPGTKQFEIPDGPLRSNREPGDRRPLADVHPATTLIDLRPDGFEPKVGGMDFLPDGRLVLCTWSPDGEVFILENVGGDDVETSNIRVTKFASGLAEPLGVAVMDGRIFVLQKQELTELIDHDGDGTADEYRAAVTGWPVTDNFHEFAFGLAQKDGLLYANLAVAIDPGGKTTEPQIPGRGTAIAMDVDAGTYETVAAGLRTPNGIGTGVDGELFVLDNQGDWLPSSKMVHLREGGFYNSYITPPHPLSEREPIPPVVWLPHGEIGNSPTNPVPVPDGWGPYAGQMLHGDVTHGGVKRTFVEEVDGQYQGVVFRFAQGLEAGTNRIAVGPDGDLYVGMIGSNGNWQQAGKQQWYGLQKLSWNGEVPFEMLAVRPGNGGVEIEFTKPLAGQIEADGFRVQSWRYEPTQQYGGPKIDVCQHDVAGVTVSPDGERAWLELDEAVDAGRVIYVLLRDGVTGEGGEEPWTTEAWYTMNVQPDRRPDYAKEERTIKEDEDGFITLFDGTSESAAASWRGYKKDALPDPWQVRDGTLTLTRAGGGDIVTTETFGDFDLRLEWKVSEGGNSGVFYRVSEEGEGTETAWKTGLEMQVLDDERHGDARNGRDRMAGALYGLYPVPDPSPVNPAGEWNAVRVVYESGRVQHFLNSEKIVDVEIGSDDWNRRIAASKFKDMPRFAKESTGRIGLQDHGDVVSFRDVRIKRLD